LIKFSIITVCYNASQNIAATLHSIVTQNYTDFELIIIDGLSTDNTLQIAKQFDPNIIISEPDKGIYDAMNKGIELATGDYINFMNVGDCFNDPTILSQIAALHSDADILYGNHIADYGYFTRYQAAGLPDDLWKGCCICHQTVFIKSNILKKNKFDIKYKFAADYHLLMQLYKKHFLFYHTKITISKQAAMGYSELHDIAMRKEWQQINYQYDTSFTMQIHYTWMIYTRHIVNFTKKILPRFIIEYITKTLYSK